MSNAMEIYLQRVRRIELLLRWLANVLKAHAERASWNKTNPNRLWPRCGDLEYVEDQLKEALSFLSAEPLDEINSQLIDEGRKHD